MSFLKQSDIPLNCNNARKVPKDGVKASGNTIQLQRKMVNCVLALNYSSQFLLCIESNLCNIGCVSPFFSFLHKNV